MTAPATADRPTLPGSLATNPRLDTWLSFAPDGTVTVRVGKVELGQGVHDALARIAADELDVPLASVRIAPATTVAGPNEGITAGSRSMEESGEAIRHACAEARALFVAAAARRLEVEPEAIEVHEGRFRVRGRGPAASVGSGVGSDAGATVDYGQLAGSVDLAREATAAATPKPADALAIVGRDGAGPRADVAARVFGEPLFVHDLVLPAMAFGRVVRPPSYGAKLEAVDDAPVRAMPGVLAIVRDGSFLGVVAGREDEAARAAEALAAAARWRDDGPALPDEATIPALLPTLPSEDTVARDDPAPDLAAPGVVVHEATFSKPYIAHGSIGPSAAVARWSGGAAADALEVWCHSQGIHPLRGDLARVLDLPPASIAVHHVDGAGCYGHNGADDVALDAALLARAVAPRPVKVAWTRADELAWEPYGSAMVVRVRAALAPDGALLRWEHDLWSDTHSTRPGRGPGTSLLAARHLAEPWPLAPQNDTPLPAGGSHRNALPYYRVPSQRVVRHLVEGPLRASALRALGGYANVFAIESTMDELAALAGLDPVAFRLRHLDDPRAKAVIEAAVSASGWRPGEPSPDGTGRGIGFARYKNVGMYCAVVAEVTVEPDLRVVRAWAAVDVGRVVSPDGVRNQVEGGVIQATSWTVKERVRFDRAGVTSRSWETYPILGFAEAPSVEVVLLDRPDQPSKGAGEGAQGPTAAAIGNALFGALGVRVRDLPLTREQIVRAMS